MLPQNTMTNPNHVKPEHLAALWARVDELGELIADDLHAPGGIEEFDALRAVLRVVDPAQSATLDSIL